MPKHQYLTLQTDAIGQVEVNGVFRAADDLASLEEAYIAVCKTPDYKLALLYGKGSSLTGLQFESQNGDSATISIGTEVLLIPVKALKNFTESNQNILGNIDIEYLALNVVYL